MTAPTHVAFGVLTTSGLFSIFSVALHQDLPALGAAMLGSLRDLLPIILVIAFFQFFV